MIAARLVRAGTGLAVAGAVAALGNRLTMRQLRPHDATVTERVTVCVPARDEADRLPALIADLLAQQGLPHLRVIVLDDASIDGTYAAAAAAISGDSRFTLVRNETEPPAGWNGKTAACDLLAALAGASPSPRDRSKSRADGGPGGTDDPIDRLGEPAAFSAKTQPDRETGANWHESDCDAGTLVFLDADVRLTPGALAAAVGELRRSGAALVCPWPRQRAGSLAEWLVQPLLAWSWASTLPVAVGNRSLRPSMAVACGQFLVFDAAAYRAIGGHTAVAGEVTEDLAIARELRRAGRRTVLVGGGQVAATRMYRGAGEVEAGYTRWLWSAYGGPAGSLAVGAFAALAYWVPPLAALGGRGRVRRIGALGYAAGVAGRLLARSTENGGPIARADIFAALAHPVSIAAYARLSAYSHRAHRARALSWKGRALPTDR
ncbi:glycosyltransferase [Nocardia yamanashiensis]|uniref:glycosyltransferase n=1 Tax=Nocardia yamanashiensis TaxID=209247 RepID=UPI001E4CAC51|nr:glycosyltransferase family 2 protein [Nocardia yamanashiensis]UGT41008.1 glycosyltransferase [Nocardia yamanashiensis]